MGIESVSARYKIPVHGNAWNLMASKSALICPRIVKYLIVVQKAGRFVPKVWRGTQSLQRCLFGHEVRDSGWPCAALVADWLNCACQFVFLQLVLRMLRGYLQWYAMVFALRLFCQEVIGVVFRVYLEFRTQVHVDDARFQSCGRRHAVLRFKKHFGLWNSRRRTTTCSFR